MYTVLSNSLNQSEINFNSRGKQWIRIMATKLFDSDERATTLRFSRASKRLNLLTLVFCCAPPKRQIIFPSSFFKFSNNSRVKSKFSQFVNPPADSADSPIPQMASSQVEPCLTCFRKTDNYLRIADETNADDVERIVTTHFWFSVSFSFF